MSWDEPYDDGSAFDAALEAGWWSDEDVTELRDLLKHYEFPDPFPRLGNRNDAIMVLLDHKLNPPDARLHPPGYEEPLITWAKTILKDVL